VDLVILNPSATLRVNSVKMLVLYLDVPFFNSTISAMLLQGKVVFGCCRTSIFTEFTLSVAEGLRMTKASRVLLSNFASALCFMTVNLPTDIGKRKGPARAGPFLLPTEISR
jgi:hypothetical protein